MKRRLFLIAATGLFLLSNPAHAQNSADPQAEARFHASVIRHIEMQVNYELACPVGSTVMGNGQTLNPTTGLYRAWLCVDATGHVTVQATIAGAAPGGIAGNVQTNNAGVFGGISGSSVVNATGALTLTSSGDTVTPLTIFEHSVTQSASPFTISSLTGGDALQFAINTCAVPTTCAHQVELMGTSNSFNDSATLVLGGRSIGPLATTPLQSFLITDSPTFSDASFVRVESDILNVQDSFINLCVMNKAETQTPCMTLDAGLGLTQQDLRFNGGVAEPVALVNGTWTPGHLLKAGPLGTGSVNPIEAQQSSITDNGTIVSFAEAVSLGAGPWIDVTNPLYGAKCDNSTNDATALQNAFTAAATTTGLVLIPKGTCITNSALTVPNKVHLFGLNDGDTGAQGSVIKMGPSFPTSTPLLIMGTTPNSFQVQVTDLTINCNGVAGSIGIQNNWSQENSFAQRVTFGGCLAEDVDVETTGAQNSGPYQNLFMGSKTGAGAATQCIKINNVPGLRGVRSFTCDMTGYTTEPTYAVTMDGAGAVLEDGHFQNSVNGLALGFNAATYGVEASNLTGGAVMTNLIDVAPSGTNAVYNYTFKNLTQNGATNAVADGQTGNTFSAPSFGSIGLYACGDLFGKNKTCISTIPNLPTVFGGTGFNLIGSSSGNQATIKADPNQNAMTFTLPNTGSGVFCIGGNTCTSPTFITPALGAATGTSVAVTGALSTGSVGVSSGLVNLLGTTSGTATVQGPAVAGTATNPIAISNSLQLPSGTVYNWNADTGLSRDAAAIVDVGNGTAGNASAILRTGNTVAVASNFTTASTSLVTITGLTWTFPATNHNYTFHCDLSYSQATAAAANAFGVQAATTAPTNLYAAMNVSTGLAITGVDATLPTLATTTATNIGTFTPSAAGAIGTIADIFTAQIWGRLEQGAGATTLNIMALTGSASDSLTIYRGSTCTLYP